jgi:hypothetical protein
MSKRKLGKRVQQYTDTLQNWSYGSFFHDLLLSAVNVLCFASAERMQRDPQGGNTFTRNGPAAIVLRVIGFDL